VTSKGRRFGPYTEAMDATIERVRSGGGTWCDCAEAIGMLRSEASLVRQRARTARLPSYQSKPRSKPPEIGVRAPEPAPKVVRAPTLAELVPLRSLR